MHTSMCNSLTNYLSCFDTILNWQKPDNVGFDIRGDVKLFDFGLAKELMPRERVGKDQYKASGLTGSR